MDEFTYLIVALNENGESLGALSHPLFGAWAFESVQEAEEFLTRDQENGEVPPLPDGAEIRIMSAAEYNTLPWASR